VNFGPTTSTGALIGRYSCLSQVIGVPFDPNLCSTDFNTLYDRREINLCFRPILILKQADHLSPEVKDGRLADFVHAVSRAYSLG